MRGARWAAPVRTVFTVPGHTLRHDGSRRYTTDGTDAVKAAYAAGIEVVDRTGFRASCSCGALSPVDAVRQSDVRAWHLAHRHEVTA